MAYSKSNKRNTSAKRSNISRRNSAKKFPRFPIVPRGNKYAPRKIVRKKPNTDDRFEVIEELYTPFARACKIESSQESREEYSLREDFDYSLGSISIMSNCFLCSFAMESI